MESGFFDGSFPASALSFGVLSSLCCDSSAANRLLSAKSPVFTDAAVASSCCSLSVALTFAAAVPGSGATAAGSVVGLGSGPFRCRRLVGTAT